MASDDELVALAALHGKLQLVTYGLIDYLVSRGIANLQELVVHVDDYAKRRGQDVALRISDELDDAGPPGPERDSPAPGG
jgi:hypothetical protein